MKTNKMCPGVRVRIGSLIFFWETSIRKSSRNIAAQLSQLVFNERQIKYVVSVYDHEA